MLDNLRLGYVGWHMLNQLREGTMDTATLSQLLTLLIPVLTPLAIRGIKLLVPKLPSFLLPLLAPVLGAAQAAMTGSVDPGTGAMLGLAGVGVREVSDQIRKAASGTKAN